MKLAIALVGVGLVACSRGAPPPSNTGPSSSPPAPPPDFAAMFVGCQAEIDHVSEIPVSKQCIAYATAGMETAAGRAATSVNVEKLCGDEFGGIVNTQGLACRAYALWLQDQIHDGISPQRLRAITGRTAQYLDNGCTDGDRASCAIRDTKRDASGRVWQLTTDNMIFDALPP